MYEKKAILNDTSIGYSFKYIFRETTNYSYKYVGLH